MLIFQGVSIHYNFPGVPYQGTNISTLLNGTSKSLGYLGRSAGFSQRPGPQVVSTMETSAFVGHERLYVPRPSSLGADRGGNDGNIQGRL